MDDTLMVREVWSDDLWRLTTVTVGELAGYSYPGPRRHIRDLTELDGAEASTFGEVLASTSRAIRDATGAELVYLYAFGEGVERSVPPPAPRDHDGRHRRDPQPPLPLNRPVPA